MASTGGEPSIGVLFELRCARTRPGECVSVVGGYQELGAWDPYAQRQNTLQLCTGAVCYPRWAMLTPVRVSIGSEEGGSVSNLAEVLRDVPEEEHEDPEDEHLEEEEPARCPSQTSFDEGQNMLRLEYKYVRDRRGMTDSGPSIQWEDSIANRSVLLPAEPGSIWIVSDTAFNEAGETPTVTRASLVDILSRQEALTMACTTSAPMSKNANVSSRLPLAPEWAGNDREEDERSLASVQTSNSCNSRVSCHTTSTRGFFNFGNNN